MTESKSSYKAITILGALVALPVLYIFVTGVLMPANIKPPSNKHHKDTEPEVPPAKDLPLKVVPHKDVHKGTPHGSDVKQDGEKMPEPQPNPVKEEPPPKPAPEEPVKPKEVTTPEPVVKQGNDDQQAASGNGNSDYATIIAKMKPPPGADSGEKAEAVVEKLRKEWKLKGKKECMTFYSQHNQDWFVLLNYFNHFTKPGFYMDVGANHAQVISNTWFLDKCLGWKGICVEPNPLLAKELRENRGCTVFNGCASHEPSNLTLVIEGGIDVAAHVVGPGYKKKNPADQLVSVECQPIVGLMERFGVTHVDFLSLDVEGHEPNALAAFPSTDSEYTVDVIAIEISTGRIQRALSQVPLMFRGYQCILPLVGDGLFVRRTWELLRPEMRMPKNSYYDVWWQRLCLRFEKLTNPICGKLGAQYIGKPPLEDKSSPSTNWAVQLLEKDNLVGFMTDTTAECMQSVNRGVNTHTFASNSSQDWFVITNYFPNGRETLTNSKGTFIDITNGHWKDGSNSWFMEQCLGWQGTCVVFDQKMAEEYKANRKCKVVIGCLKSLCKELNCKTGTCETLDCGEIKPGKGSSKSDPKGCTPISKILSANKHTDVVSVDIAYGPYVVGLSEWTDVQSVDVWVVNGGPKTNYKLMHWPLSVRGFALVATFSGSDVFVKQVARLIRPSLHFPVGNLDWNEWLSDEYAKHGVASDVVKAIMKPTDHDVPEMDI
eukprot:TRINITY_DN60531_c0_g1_i1.p1 TRINITY_DN60531_c0_g1~~TRINITY_DN60531_c0_g1_i1.p1  ORF type:complete len:722 (+),score=49.05 TRINITY_DN60531_c0_g1_i1:24-2168(+)